MKTFTGMSSKSDEKCTVCGKAIENRLERVSLPGVMLHQSCFQCSKCGENLSRIPYGILEGTYYCKKHHTELLKEGGGSLLKARTAFQMDRRSYSTQFPSSPRVTRKPLLKVTVVKGENLAAKDDTGLSDPYVQLTFRGKTFQTKVISETVNPVWNDSFEIFAGRDDQMKLVCWDYDEGTLGDFLGQATIELGEILDKVENSSSSCEEIYTLQTSNPKVPSDITGSIYINFLVQQNQTDLQNKDKLLQDRLSKFLEVCKYPPDNIREWLAIPSYDSKKRRLNEIATLKAKQVVEFLKRNASVPLSLVRDLKIMVTEKAFLRAFAAIEGSIETLVLFFTDPNVKPGSQNEEVSSPFPEENPDYLKSPLTTPRNTSGSTLSSVSALSRTKSLLRTTSVSFQQPVVTFSDTDTDGLQYEISGRNAAGGTEGTLCTFSVFFRLDGKPISNVEKEELQVFVDCPGGQPSLMIMPGTSGVGYYQIGLKPKAGQHWFDFVWKGNWCKSPFLLRIQNKNGSVPDHPYVGQDRKNAGFECSSLVIPPSTSTPVATPSPAHDSTPSSPLSSNIPSFTLSLPTAEEKKSEPDILSARGVTPRLLFEFPDLKVDPLVEDQFRVRGSIMEIIKDYMLSNARTAYVLVDPVIVNTIVECIAESGLELLNISLFSVLGVLPTVSRVFEGIRWDGRALVLNAMKYFQQVAAEEQPFETIVKLLKYTDVASHALTAFIVVNSLLDSDRIEERCVIRSQLIAADILGALKSVKHKFPRNSSLLAQIFEFEQEMSIDERTLKEPESSDPKATVQSILTNLNNTALNNSFVNILKGLSVISKQPEIHKTEWSSIEQLVQQLSDDSSLTFEDQLKFEIRKHATQSKLPKNTKAISDYTGTVPSKSLRTFIWNSVDSDLDLNATVFSQFKLDSVKIDASSLEALFAADTKTKAKTSFLTPNRKTEICILLSKFTRSNQEGIAGFKDLILSFKADKLTEPILKEIFLCLPQDAERHAWHEWLSANPDHSTIKENFAQPDIFHFTIVSEIKDILQRIYLLQYSFFVKKFLGRMKEPINAVSSAANSIVQSNDVPRVIEIILAVGRFLNSKNTGFENYSAFDIQILGRLKQVKANDGRSLLDVIVSIVSTSHSHLLNWDQSLFSSLQTSIKVSWEKIESEFNQAKQESEFVGELVKQISGTEAQQFFTKYNNDLNEFLSKKDEAYNHYKSVAAKYGLNIKYFHPDDVIRIFFNFAQDWKAASQRIKSKQSKNRDITFERRKTEIQNRTQTNTSKSDLQKKIVPKTTKFDEAREKTAPSLIKDTLNEILTKGVTYSRKEGS